MSRDILLLNQHDAIGAQLVHLVLEAFEFTGVSLWDAREARLDVAGTLGTPDDEVRAVYFHQRGGSDAARGRFERILLIGNRAVGAIVIAGDSGRARIGPQTADAIASLAALALERAHSFRSEGEAEAARQSEQLRSALLDGLSHAFKTPLTVIQTSSSGLLEMGALGPAQEELVTLINQEALRLGDLTTQALQIARISSDDLKMTKKEVLLRPLLAEISEQCANGLADHELLVQGDVSGESVCADGRLLKLALLELIDNASKYADPATPILLRASEMRDQVVFCVRNEGPCIPAEERPRIFRRFYRSPGSQYRAAGTGIGLSFVKQIAEAHSGQVWVESEPATGTMFFLSLPAPKAVLRQDMACAQ